jgi:hypothetical protein
MQKTSRIRFVEKLPLKQKLPMNLPWQKVSLSKHPPSTAPLFQAKNINRSTFRVVKAWMKLLKYGKPAPLFS